MPITYTEKAKGIVKFIYSKEDYNAWNEQGKKVGRLAKLIL